MTHITVKEAPMVEQKKVFDYLLERIKRSGLAELHALEVKVERLYNNGLLNQSQLSKLDSMITDGLCRWRDVVHMK